MSKYMYLQNGLSLATKMRGMEGSRIGLQREERK